MNTLPILTWSDFDLFEPCYSPQERYGDFSGTILEILKDERIPNDDKIWAATCKGILPDYVNKKFATQCCRQVWHLLTDERSRTAVEVAERFNEGKATQGELAAALAAARAAAWAAALDAASDAALAAARAAALAAAWDVSRDVSRDVSTNVSRDAAGAAQVKLLIEIIETHYASKKLKEGER